MHLWEETVYKKDAILVNVESDLLSIFIGRRNNESLAADNRNETANSLCALESFLSLFPVRRTYEFGL